MPLYPDLTGRKALVTGGSRGIGAAVALLLAEAGADVAVNYVRNADAADKVAAAIARLDRRGFPIAADVSDSAQVSAMFKRLDAEFGGIDILVNNAGIAIRGGVDDLSEADFERTIAVNLKSVFLCSQAALPHMRAQAWGRIVNISSGAARGAGGVSPIYNASKAGMEGLTRGYAARLVKEGITVNAVAPSLVETDMVRSGSGLAAAAARIPLGRMGTVEEVAQVVLMLVGNAYMTGQAVALSGGLAFN